MKRRDMTRMISLSTLLPIQWIHAMTSMGHPRGHDSGKGVEILVDESNKRIRKMYDEAMVIDGLVIPRGWDNRSFEALSRSGYTGFCASLASANLGVALEALDEWNKRIVDNPDRLVLAKGPEDFVKAKQEGKAAVLFGFQNATMIERSIDNLNTLYREGTRWVQLTYNQRNLLGDGCTERTNAGLSDFGLEALDRMNDLGIIVDLSHCGRQTTMDGLRFSTSGACFNHSMCESLYKGHPRAKTDEEIKLMANKGGIMGIICLGYMIGPDPGGETTLETYLDHIDHAVKVAGMEHVGLASDFAIQGLEAVGSTRENWYLPRLTRFKPSYQVRWPPWIPELDGTDRYRHVAMGLDRRGYKQADIEKILGGNWLRYFGEVLKN